MNWFKKKWKYTDEDIIRIIQNGSRLETAKLETYLIDEAFYPLLHSKKAKDKLESLELRVDAYNAAFVSFIIDIRLQKFRGESSVTTFFMEIFLNRCIDNYRKISTEKHKANRPASIAIEEALRNLSDTSQNILENLIQKTDLEFVFQQLKAVSESCFQIISLRSQGYNYQEIGEILDKSPNGVKSTHNQCLKKVINKLKGNKI